MSFAIILPFIAGVCLYFLRSYKRLIPLVGILLFGFELILLTMLYFFKPVEIPVGGWTPPYGIVLSADAVSKLIAPFIAFVFLITGWMLPKDPAVKRIDLTYSFLFFLQGGVLLALFTGDFFNLFVSFEVMLTASYALFAMQDQKGEGILTYVTLNLVGGMIFLTAAGVAYGAFGVLNLDLLKTSMGGPYLSAFGALVLIIVALKSAFYPIFLWLPHAYKALPPTLQALFGGVLTKIGVYVGYRLLIGLSLTQIAWMPPVLLFIASLTMIVGVLAAISQQTISGILSHHIVSQVGYMLFGIALGSEVAISAGLFFLLHNVITKSSLFLVGGEVERQYGTQDLGEVSGVGLANPFFGALFLLFALSLAGFPPFSGFWGKYLLFQEGIRMGAYTTTAVAIVTSWLTLFSMIKIWYYCFWGSENLLERGKFTLAPLVIAALLMSAMGIFAEPLLKSTTLAAKELTQ